jgi:hypothetical protein
MAAPGPAASAAAARTSESAATGTAAPARHRAAGRGVRLAAWRWAQDNRAEDGPLPSGTEIARKYGQHERWGRLVKRAGLAGELGT